MNAQTISVSSYDAEQGLLRLFCQHKEILGYVSESILPEYFTDINRLLYTAIYELFKTNFAIDAITISHYLTRIPHGSRVPSSIISDLFQPEDKNKLEAYLSIVTEHYKARNYQSMMVELQKAMTENKSSGIMAEIVSRYNSNIDLGISKPKSIDMVVANYEKELTEDIFHGRKVDRNLIGFGINKLDSHDLMRPGNIYIVAGRPGKGKTSLMIQAAYHNAFIEKKRVVIFSLEMTNIELLEKIYCRHANIDSEIWLKMDKKVKLKEMQVFKSFIIANHIDLIVDEQCHELESIVNRAAALNAQKPIDLICIDYAQLITGGKSEDLRVVLVRAMKTIKNHVAKKLNTVVMLLSQIGKDVEKQNNRIPVLADLMESSAIEQVAASAFFLHSVSPNLRSTFDDEGHIPNNGETLIVINKSRFGRVGILPMWFAGGVNLFVEKLQELIQIKIKTNKNRSEYIGIPFVEDTPEILNLKGLLQEGIK